MFDFSNAELDITKEEILAKISEYQIFKYYCRNFEELDKSFLSEFYLDSNPSCRIYINNNNNLYYKDFGTGEHLSCFDYICKKYNITYYECLRVISNDFNIRSIKVNVEPSLIVSNDVLNIPVKPRIKSHIEIVSQNYTITDARYWSKYHIPLQMLEDYDVFSARFVYLHTSKGSTVFEYKKSNPIYAYRFVGDNKYSYKIYFPLAERKYKWLFSGGSKDDIEGFDNLDMSGEYLILTKSLKDCMAYRLFGINAISLQGEANKLSSELVQKILKRYDKIILNYDNDDQGIKSAASLTQQYGFSSYIFDDAKDLSDLIKDKGIRFAKKTLENKLGVKLKMNKKYE